MNIYRQGDVLIRQVDRALPEGAEKVDRDRGRVVLAYGEVTGHAHAITAEHCDLYELSDTDVRMLIVEAESVLLEHDEHAAIELPKGTYEVVNQVEYSPEAIRRVAGLNNRPRGEPPRLAAGEGT